MAATGDEFTLGGTTTAATTIDFLDGLDLSTASLEDMTEALRKLEGQKQDVIEDIRQLRVRLENEKVHPLLCYHAKQSLFFQAGD